MGEVGQPIRKKDAKKLCDISTGSSNDLQRATMK